MIHNVMFAVATLPNNHYLFGGLIEGVKNNVVRGAQDLLQSFFWSILSGLLGMVNSLLNSIVNGVIGLDLFSHNEFLSTAFNCSLALMFLAIPAKITWEIVSAMIRDDDAGMDIHKKLGSTALGIAIACSLTVGITKIINPVMQDASKAILNVNLTNEIKSDSATSQLGDSLIESVLISFGGLPKDGDYGASKFVEQYNKNELKITKRDGDNYVWDFSIFMAIIGMCVYVVMLFVICIQIAVRVISIGFYYVIGPLACTSMTNYQNPQAFNVWKATIFGAWAQNLTQIFLLSLFVGLLESISSATSTMPVASVALYFGAFSLIMTAPNFVQAMIGGYASGILDTLNQFRGGLGMAKSLVTGAVGSVIGRNNPHTGHLEGGARGKILGDVNAQGNRVGGARGAIFGNPDSNGNRNGGIKGATLGNSMNMGGVTGRQGGIRGAIFGNDQLASGVGGTIERTRAGGMANIGGKKRTDSFNSAGQKTGSMQKRRLSAFRGSDSTAFNPETGAQMGDPVHQRGPVPMFLSDLGNRFSGGGSDQSSDGGGSDTSTPNYTSFNSGGGGASGGGSSGGTSGGSGGSSGVGGTIERTRAGGMANIGGKKRTDSFNSAGQKTGSMQKRRLSAFRGSDSTAFNPETGAQMGDPVHQRGPVPMFLSDLGNRFSGGGSDQSSDGGGSDTSTPNYTSFNSGGGGASGGGSSGGTSGGSGGSSGVGGSTGGAHSFQMHSSASTRNSLGGAQSSGPKPQPQGQRPSSSTKPAVRSSGTNGNTKPRSQAQKPSASGAHTYKMKSSSEIRNSLGNRGNSGGKK